MEENLDNVVEELKEKAAEDLEGAVKIEYGNEMADVEVVNNVKAKLEDMLENLNAGKSEYFNKTNDNLTKFRELATYFQSSIDANAVTNTNLANLLTEQLNSVNKAIAELEKSLNEYDNKVSVISKALEHFKFKVSEEDGKCYVEQYAIDFARLLLA